MLRCMPTGNQVIIILAKLFAETEILPFFNKHSEIFATNVHSRRKFNKDQTHAIKDINNRHKVFTDIDFSLFECLFITVSSSCSSYMCECEEWLTGSRRVSSDYDPVSGSSNIEEQIDFEVSPFVSYIQTVHIYFYIHHQHVEKKKNPIKLWYPAQTACWMQVLIQYTNIRYIRTRTTHVHTNRSTYALFFSLYTQ